MMVMTKFERILVAVDGSPTSTNALHAALSLATDFNSVVRLIHVIEESGHLKGFKYSEDFLPHARRAAEQVLNDALALAEVEGVEASAQLAHVPGRPLGETIADEARRWEADLVVVGTHGRKGVARVLLGSGAEQIIRLAPVAVLVVRDPQLHG
jgi:nucleotide-binding universal stress UspA family protein